MVILCVYFAFYLVFGPRGLLALQRMDATHEAKHQEYETIKTQRENLEADVKLMRPDSLDPDMADEQARKALGYAKPDEIILDLP